MMIKELRMSRESPDQSTKLDADEFASLLHDIRSCIHAMRIGREVLKTMHDEQRFIDVCTAMEQEERTALQLLGRLSSVVRKSESCTTNIK